VTGNVLTNDTDVDAGTALTVSVVANPARGTLVLNPDGSFTYTPAADFSGGDSFTYKANDGTAESNVATVTIAVTAVNDAPVAVADAVTTAEDTPSTIAVLANDTDPDGDTLVVSGVSAPLHGTAAVNPDGTVTYAPGPNYDGPDTFTYTAGDGHGGTATGTVSITVTAGNDAPIAVNDAMTVDEDTAGTGNVLTNDTDPDGGTALTVSVVANPAHGTLVMNPDGSFTYTPAADFSGGDSFTYTANDGSADSNVTTVMITVAAVNDAPLAVDDAVTATEDTAVTGNVLTNDTDADGGTALTASLVSSPAHGTLALNPDGGFTYTPAADFNGSDSFTYNANDGALESNVATMTITVAAGNDQPVAVDDAATTAEDMPATIAVLLNDTDLDGDTLVVSGVSAPLHGNATVNPDGTLTYAPAPNYDGPDTFTYTAADGHGGTATGTVNITVTAANDAPVAAGDSYTVAENGSLPIAVPGVLGNDSDLEGSRLTAVMVQGPAHGTVVLNADGDFTYTPTGGFNGADSFIYRANDGALSSPPASVTLTVTAVNDAPSAANQSVTARLGAPAAITLTATDVDNDALTYRVSVPPAHGALTGTAPNLVYTPTAGFLGMDTFEFIANDGTSDSNAAIVSIRVMGVNRPPEAEDQWVFFDEDTPTLVPLLAGDPEGDPLTFTIVTPPSYGTLEGIAPNLTYKPGPDFNGWDYFTFIASDGVFDSNEASVNFWIWEVNDPPVAQNVQLEAALDVQVATGEATVIGQLAVTDAEGDWLYYALESGPNYGTVSIDSESGAFTYTPGPNSTGPDHFTYIAYDWQTQSNVGTVEIVLTP
jgi:VCBS repeat-containing protein